MVVTYPWDEMNAIIGEEIDEFRSINSGIHIGLLATNRGGKTTLVTGANQGNGLLSHFEDVLVIDSTGDPGFIKDYGKPLQKYVGIHGHRRLSVNATTPGTRSHIFSSIQKAKRQGNIAIYVDELRQLVDGKFFDLAPVLDDLWLFSAKKGVSLIAGTQAPRWIPGAFYDQTKMAFISKMRDARTRKRLAEIGGGGVDGKELDYVVSQLERYQFAHIGIDGDISISKFDLKPKRQETRNIEKQPSRNVRVVKSGAS